MMTPRRTGGDHGRFEFDRVFPKPVGRLHQSSGAETVREFNRRNALLTKLRETGQLTLLLALKNRDVSIEQLLDADRRDGLHTTLDVVKLRAPLWDAVEELVPKLGKSPMTRRRYMGSFRALQVKAKKWLGDRAKVGDLQSVDWHALHASWGTGPADWNRLRTALSAFLSAFLGKNRRAGKYHPMRYEILANIPIDAEPPPASPDVTPATFVAIVSKIDRPDLAAPFWTLALTGFRIAEYLACGADDLLHHTHSVNNPFGKTGERFVAVDPTQWHWIRRGIPCRVGRRPAERVPVQFDSRYKRLRRIWRAAAAAAKLPMPTFHELRHCHGQWAHDAGVDEAKVGAQLGHKDPRTTRRYTMTRNKGEVARAVGSALARAVAARKAKRVRRAG